MIKFLLDQGLPRSTAELLTASGIDTIHVGEVNNESFIPATVDHTHERGCYQKLRMHTRGWQKVALQYMCATRCLLINGSILK